MNVPLALLLIVSLKRVANIELLFNLIQTKKQYFFQASLTASYHPDIIL